MILWVRVAQLLVVISLTRAVEDKESFESYFQNFFKRNQDKIPRAITNSGPQNGVQQLSQPKGLPYQSLPVKTNQGRLITPSLQAYSYQVVPRYTFYNLPPAVQYRPPYVVQPPSQKYAKTFIPHYQAQATFNYNPDPTLKFRTEDAVKSYNPSYSPSFQAPVGDYLQFNKDFSGADQKLKVKEVREDLSSKFKENKFGEQPPPPPQYSYTVRQQRQFQKFPPKDLAFDQQKKYNEGDKKKQDGDDEYYYKGSDDGTHEHVKVKSSYTHKKQTTGGTEDYFDGDYGEYDSKKGY